ncbi:hypothetical protein KQI76_03510 [Amphibacillus sp. MSJ-3]|uniref:hypothetical protein n=1 Tax=Amphibacillus sp. MSJ-3 TaxID=2841505 RepID=UPI001C0F24DE|nr:hypothetical protein [Amphibacillus sp. MSJ-3]MBU5594221.1 hypothetical protein [Amphibacillus sp. MSJ-3]
MLGLVNHFLAFVSSKQTAIDDAFQGIELLNAALIIFAFIIVCLSYAMFKLYQSSRSHQSAPKVNKIINDNDDFKEG